GDYNICLQQNNCHKIELQNTMQSNSLYPTILAPTRVASIMRDGQLVTTNSLIDNIYLNTQSKFQSGILEVSISDHYPIFALINEQSIPSSNKETTIKYRLINENTLNKFKYDLANNPEISNIFRTNSGQEAFSKFLTLFSNLYDIYFPIKSKKNLLEKDYSNPG
ncbi:unnamed protein product, partial [Meganyctiphanes norvegica]